MYCCKNLKFTAKKKLSTMKSRLRKKPNLFPDYFFKRIENFFWKKHCLKFVQFSYEISKPYVLHV